MGRYEEADLSGVRRIRIGERASKVDEAMLAGDIEQLESFTEFWDRLPGALAAPELRELARAIARAHERGRPIIWMFGAHVIKVGLSPLLTRLVGDGLATLVAVNGAFVIHDAELALWGKTSEDVASELHAGRFGMARETTEFINLATTSASERDEGLGEGIGRALLEREADWAMTSVVGECYRREVPVTVHLAVGTDITHQHPEFSGRAAGEASARDFRIFAAHLRELDGAVVVNVGSAVILPEVFLKALSVAINLGANCAGLVTASLDFVRHYRPRVNVVERPRGPGGKGISLVGHHEIMLPLLIRGSLLELKRLRVGSASR